MTCSARPNGTAIYITIPLIDNSNVKKVYNDVKDSRAISRSPRQSRPTRRSRSISRTERRRRGRPSQTQRAAPGVSGGGEGILWTAGARAVAAANRSTEHARPRGDKHPQALRRRSRPRGWPPLRSTRGRCMRSSVRMVAARARFARSSQERSVQTRANSPSTARMSPLPIRAPRRPGAWRCSIRS